jgi:hypothetical protein
MESTEKILENPEDYEGRASMRWAATWRSTGWQRPVLANVASQVHRIMHSLRAVCDISHGAGLSIVLPGRRKYASIP